MFTHLTCIQPRPNQSYIFRNYQTWTLPGPEFYHISKRQRLFSPNSVHDMHNSKTIFRVCSLKKISKIRTTVNNLEGEDNPLPYLLIILNPNKFCMKTRSISEMMIVNVSLHWLHQISYYIINLSKLCKDYIKWLYLMMSR